MNRSRKIVLGIAFAASALAAGVFASTKGEAPEARPTGDPTKGRKLYAARCVPCQGLKSADIEHLIAFIRTFARAADAKPGPGAVAKPGDGAKGDRSKRAPDPQAGGTKQTAAAAAGRESRRRPRGSRAAASNLSECRCGRA